MKKTLIFSLLFAALTGFSVTSAFAAESQCQPIYGGGQTCVQTGNVTIDKKVQKPGTNDMIDNVTVSDPKFTAENAVHFTLSIHNASNKTIETVTVKDVLPQYLTFAGGPGSYDPATKTLTIVLTDLKADETRTIDVNAKVVPANELPASGTVCVVNQGLVTAEGKTNQDNANLCIEKPTAPTTGTKGGQPMPTQPAQTKGGLPVYSAPTTKTTPSTGPEMLGLIGLIPAGVLGQFLRKKSSK